MTKETKIKVGDSVYHLQSPLLSKASRPKADVIVELRVVKVGRKYFYTMLTPQDAYSSTQWYLDSLREVGDHYPRLQCFRTRQALQDKQDRDRIYALLREEFRVYQSAGNLSIDQLRRIEAITKE